MRRYLVIPLLMACVFHAGCSQIQAKINADVQAATIPDIQAALADAQAASDADGVACWTDVLAYINALPTTTAGAPVPSIKGVASGLEAARIAAAAAPVTIPPIPPQLHRDCAVLIVDFQETAAKLGLSAAALNKGVGAAKILNALPSAPPHP